MLICQVSNWTISIANTAAAGIAGFIYGEWRLIKLFFLHRFCAFYSHLLLRNHLDLKFIDGKESEIFLLFVLQPNRHFSIFKYSISPR